MLDAPTRLFHWALVLSFAGAWLTADGERWRQVHVTLGWTVLGLVLWRGVYGLAGPRGQRWPALWGRLRGWAQLAPGLLRAVRAPRRAAAGLRPDMPAPAAAGVLQGTAIVLLLGLALAASGTGWLTYEEWAGEWMAELHEALADALALVVAAHLALVAVASLLRRQNLARMMWSGRLPGTGPDIVAANRAWLAAAMLAAIMAFWGWMASGAPAAASAPAPAGAAAAAGRDTVPGAPGAPNLAAGRHDPAKAARAAGPVARSDRTDARNDDDGEDD